MPEILFYAFSGTAVVSAGLMVASVRNTIYAAMWLVVTMLSLACLFILLGAEFIGLIQILVYAGAIVVLFLFVIMLLNLRGGEMGAESQPLLKVVGGVIAVAATVELLAMIGSVAAPLPELTEEFGTTVTIGRALYTDYLLPFEVTSILLLAAIIGSVVLAKRRIE